MRLPTKKQRGVSPLTKQMRENLSKKRRQDEERLARNEQVLARLRSSGGQSA